MNAKAKLLLAGLIVGAATFTGAAAMAKEATMWVGSFREGWMRPMVDAFNASHENKIKLESIPWTQMIAKYGTSIAGGVAPDAAALDHIYVPTFIAAGQLEDLTDYISALPYADKLNPAEKYTAEQDGRIYGLPFDGDNTIILWNKRLFKRAGLDPEKGPQNWTELREYAEKITALGDGIKGFNFAGNHSGLMTFTLLPVIYATGGDVFADNDTKVTVDTDPAVRRVLEAYHDLWASGFVPESAATDDASNMLSLFGADKVGMEIHGVFGVGLLQEQFGFKADEIGTGLVPGLDGGWGSFGGGDTFVITKGSPNKDVVLEFMGWAMEPENMVEYMLKKAAMPSRTDLPEELLSGLPPSYIAGWRATQYVHAPKVIGYNDIFNVPQGPWLQMLQTAILDGEIDQALEEGQAGFQKVLDANKPKN